MRYIFLVTLLCSFMFAQSYQEFAKQYGYETDYKVALQKAKQAKKDVLMVQVSNYCPWCRKLEKKILSRENINEVIHKKYIPLIVNREEKNLPKQFNTPIIPVTYIIDYEDDTAFLSLPGYKDKDEFFSFVE
ncbi:DUF255 domain-containing protein [Sulfurimonas aquatica]|uniref:DUF255 domain-containing protein n=1 Tax=Sulfurimonas aquatica TaxID=2672570 RepID=A0A975AXZ4_9BACT|nr:thioredoxin family protein [Sulfurimonas aquatica]QSZ40604.1 DUF255 domain-containing protein [Sulfurimonas aquatica]